MTRNGTFLNLMKLGLNFFSAGFSLLELLCGAVSSSLAKVPAVYEGAFYYNPTAAAKGRRKGRGEAVAAAMTARGTLGRRGAA